MLTYLPIMHNACDHRYRLSSYIEPCAANDPAGGVSDADGAQKSRYAIGLGEASHSSYCNIQLYFL